MKAVTVPSGGLDNLAIINKEAPSPKAGEVLVRWHATSLNYHDYLVAVGAIPVVPGRIPMSDGAGEVIEVGPDVMDYKVGDQVMSMFFPGWIEGNPSLMKIAGVSGETVDGYICEMSAISAKSITPIPSGFTYAEACLLYTSPSPRDRG